MKKLFLFIYLTSIAAYFGYSQMSLSLSDSTGPLANNATIYKAGTPLDDEIVAYVFVTNNSGTAVPVLVKKVVIDTVPGSLNMFCWGSCFAPTVYVSPNPITVDPGRTDSLNFSGHYVPNTYSGDSRLRYVFFSRSDPSDSVCVNIVYSAYPVGIEMLAVKATISNASPNPADGNTRISYSLPVNTNGSLVVRNLLGSIAMEFPLNGQSGSVSLNTGDLSNGVYFYSLNIDGVTGSSKKLIVRH
jgi:hypothetical protein